MLIRKLATAFAAVLIVGASAASHGAENAQDPKPRKTIVIGRETLELMTPAEVRALGFPWIDVPDAENAATYYIKGANARHKLSMDDAASDQYNHALNNPWDDAMTELAAYLDKAGPVLDHYRKGSTMKLCQLPYSKTDMIMGMLLPSLGAAREACRLLTIEARRFEAEGKFTEAVDNYIAIIRIANHHGKGRSVIGYLVGIACNAIGRRSAFDSVYASKYPAPELKRFIRALDEARSNMPDFAHAMRCEKAFGAGTIDDMMRFGPAGFPRLIDVPPVVVPPTMLVPHAQPWPGGEA